MGDYDREPQKSAGIFLQLKSKEEKCRVRIVAAPLREPKIWIEGQRAPMPAKDVASLTSGQWATAMRKPNYKITEAYHFLVIDRTDGQPKIFTTTGGVYGKIRKFATNEEWGDPKTYDLTITRTEMPGTNYYDVDPSPTKSNLNSDELALADKLMDKIRTENTLPAATLASKPQPDDINENTEPEDLPGDIHQERSYSVSPKPDDINDPWADEPLAPPEDPSDIPGDLPPE